MAHDHIAANVLTLLRTALRSRGCSAFGSDLRLVTPSGLYTYPGVLAIGGPPVLVPNPSRHGHEPCPAGRGALGRDTWLRPGGEAGRYQAIPTLREVLLIEQARVAVERVARTGAGAWEREYSNALETVVALARVDVELPLTDVYRGRPSSYLLASSA